jgi:hypothetical protein
MATHQCQHCLRKTIDDATEVTHPLVLPTSRCNAEGGTGLHNWQSLSSAPPGNLFHPSFLLISFYYDMNHIYIS